MGLTSWGGERPRKADVTIAKNYLTGEELSLLHLIVDQHLSFAEFQARQRKPMYMNDWVRKLDDFLRLNEREIPDHAGRISARLGEEIAHEEFGKYGESQKQVERVEDLNALESSIGVVEGNRKKPRGGADGQPVIPCCKSERETMCLTPNSSPTFGSDWPLPC